SESSESNLMSRLYEHLHSGQDTRKLMRFWLTEASASGLCPPPSPNGVETLDFLRDWAAQKSLLKLLPWETSARTGEPAGQAFAACMQRLYATWLSDSPPPSTSLTLNSSSSSLPSVFEFEIRPASRLAKLFTVLDLVAEQLPPLVRFTSEADSRQFNFAYHPPSSAASSTSLSSAGSFTDHQQTRSPAVEEAVQRECAVYNRQILAVGRDVQQLRRHLPAGLANLPPALAASASRLAIELVPEDWLHRNEQPNSLPLKAWLERLRRRHAQLRRLRPTGLIGSLWPGGLYEPRRLLAAMRLDKRLALSEAVHRCRLEDVRLRCELLPVTGAAGGGDSRMVRSSSRFGNSSSLRLEGVHMCGMELASDGGDKEMESGNEAANRPKLVYSDRCTISSLQGYELIVLFESAQVEDDQGSDELYECEIYTTWSKQHHVATVLLPSSVKPPDPTERGFFILDPGFLDGAYPTRPRVPIVRTPLVDELDPLDEYASADRNQQSETSQKQRLEGIDEEGSGSTGAEQNGASAPSSKRESDQASYRPFSPQASTRPESLQLERTKPIGDEAAEDEAATEDETGTPVKDSQTEQEEQPDGDKNRSAYKPEVSDITEKVEDGKDADEQEVQKNDDAQQQRDQDDEGPKDDIHEDKKSEEESVEKDKEAERTADESKA
ncbi:hypothetical protein BOX15_Mlig011306g1, partial [Macrostomum lignano]